MRKAAALIAIVAMLFVTTPVAAITWHTANQATIEWDAVTADADGDPIAAGMEVRYKLYIVNSTTDPGKTTPVLMTPAAGVLATSFQFTLATKGNYWVGVKAYLVDSATSEEVAESNFAWSDIPADCADTDADGVGNDFGIRYFVALAPLGGLRPVSIP